MQKTTARPTLEQDEFLTIPEMAKKMKIGERAAYEFVQIPGFPHYRFGERKLRIIWSEVLEWMKQHREMKGA